jgi:hypothetical protein
MEESILLYLLKVKLGEEHLTLLVESKTWRNVFFNSTERLLG